MAKSNNNRGMVPRPLKAGDEVVCINIKDHRRITPGVTYVIQVVNRAGIIIYPKHRGDHITQCTMWGKQATFIVIRKVSK